jgi:tetratricopeptide (TPR) repeat protein
MQMGPKYDARRSVRILATASTLAVAIVLTSVPRSLLAQSTVQQFSDSVYQARMNAGYAAAKAGNQLAAAIAYDSAARAAPQLADAPGAAGYAYLAAGRKSEAITRFEAALSIDGERDVLRRQLGYLYAADKRNRDAIAAFAAIQARNRATAPDLLALGNLNALVGERDVALSSFRAALNVATQTSDTATAKSARQSMTIVSQEGGSEGNAAFVEYYLSPFYQTRFQNVVSFGIARAGLTAKGWLHPSLYASLRATRDTKSVGGLQPVLYADNTLLPAIGARIQPGGKWFVLYAEAGAAYPLVNVNPRDWHRDLRAGVIGTFANQRALSGNANGLALITELYGDASWYDRFDRNLITYGQLRESLRIVQGRAGAIDLFGRAWGVVDSRDTFSNRVIEGGGGIAFHAGASHRVSLYADAVQGHYLNDGMSSLTSRNYHDFRVMLVTGLYHVFPLSRP